MHTRGPEACFRAASALRPASELLPADVEQVGQRGGRPELALCRDGVAACRIPRHVESVRNAGGTLTMLPLTRGSSIAAPLRDGRLLTAVDPGARRASIRRAYDPTRRPTRLRRQVSRRWGRPLRVQSFHKTQRRILCMKTRATLPPISRAMWRRPRLHRRARLALPNEPECLRLPESPRTKGC